MVSEISKHRGAVCLFAIALALCPIGRSAAQGGISNNAKPRSFACATLDIKKVRMKSSDLSGCLQGADQSGWPIRMRMTDLHSEKSFKVKVNSSGEFSFDDIPSGNYVLLATQGEKTIAFSTVRLPLQISPILMDLDPFTDVPAIEY